MREAHNSCLGKRLYEPSAKITIQKTKITNLYLSVNKPLTKTNTKACTTTGRQLLQTRRIIRNFAS